ncbi:hypothetical protein B0H16DRAFT_1464227 [Mycena metata]|uniref:Uncharacterized protein n=1 Tax=Mycena metata TaxID=1033252 RepID=A0AAD7N1V6_9AGAR|nr:hypothetical protein B0H16DRAFT_1467778 [Mycena metata]KAJ7742060.1 hypothetical protein B0H16DRAFT_1464227 [Mycena metata]
MARKKSKAAAADELPLTVGRSSSLAPWSFFQAECFSEFVYYFEVEHIQSSDSTVAVPLINTLRPLMIEFYRQFPPNWALDICAFVAAISLASKYLVHLHLKPRKAEYTDMFWKWPAGLEATLQNADVAMPAANFQIPNVAIKSGTLLSFSKAFDDDSDEEDEPPAKKPRLDKPSAKGRATSMESVATNTSAPSRPPTGPSTGPRATRSAAVQPEPPSSPLKPSAPPKPTIKVVKPEPKPPAASSSKTKGKNKETDPEGYLTPEQKAYADEHPPPTSREELLLSAVYSDTAPPGPWSQGLARPLPAQIRAPSVLVGDWLSPALWCKSPCKCVSCINRLKDCSDGEFGARCEPCVRGGIKCSRTNTDEEDVIMQEALRPLYALSSDAFVRVLQHAVEARRITEMHYRLFARSIEDLDRANDHVILTYINASDVSSVEAMQMHFEDPADKEHMDSLCKRVLAGTSLHALQIEHLDDNPTSGILRRDESQPDSIANTFYTPLPTRLMSRPVDPVLNLNTRANKIFVGRSATPTAPAALAPPSAPPVFGRPNAHLLPPGSAVPAPAKDAPMPPPSS